MLFNIQPNMLPGPQFHATASFSTPPTILLSDDTISSKSNIRVLFEIMMEHRLIPTSVVEADSANFNLRPELRDDGVYLALMDEADSIEAANELYITIP